MKIHFFIPFFKNTHYLKETLISLLEQKDHRWEATILDDAVDGLESQKVVSILETMPENRFKYQKNSKNLGMAANWNQAFVLGRDADLVCIVHADDQLTPDYTGEVLAAAGSVPEATAFFSATEIIGENGQRVFSFADFYKACLLPKKQGSLIYLRGQAGVKSLLRGNFIFCPTLSFRPTQLGSISFDPRFKMVLDFDLVLRLLIRGDSLVGIYSQPLYRYRRHSENASQLLTQSMVRFIEESGLYDEIATKAIDMGWPKVLSLARKKRVLQLNLIFQVCTSLLRFQFRAAFRYLRFWYSL